MTHTGRSVLIVEDDADVRGAVATILELHGYAVREANNGREALEQLANSDEVCLILLDLFMPEMNGWAFRTEQMKDPRLARIPVVVVSADPAAARRAVSPGVIAALTKPIEFGDLLELVDANC
jgi:CheY-like chemotaxis protein